MPHVEIVYKHNAAARRLSIRGHNGKVRYSLIVKFFFAFQPSLLMLLELNR